MEKPYSGLTARLQINGTTIGYINNVSLDLETDVAEISQFGAQYKEKVATIKNWTGSSEGTAAFAAGGSQEKLYLAHESGEEVTLTTKLDEGVYFEGRALISKLHIEAAPDDAISISADFEGSGGLTFTLPQTVVVRISSSVGGTTDPAGNIRVASGGQLTVNCTPSAGMEAASYSINGGAAVTITGTSFTTAAISIDSTLVVTFAQA